MPGVAARPRPPARARRRSRRTGSTASATRRALGERNDAVIAAIAGRVALPAAWRGARRAKTPFVLWASLWRHPLTVAHTLSLRADAADLPPRRRGRDLRAHVSRYVARYRKQRRRHLRRAPGRRAGDLRARGPEAEKAARGGPRSAPPPEAPIVLFAGRLVRDKGVDVLLRAWKRARTRRRRRSAWSATARCPSGVREAPATASCCAGRLERERLPVAYAAATPSWSPRSRPAASSSPGGWSATRRCTRARPVIASAAVGAVARGRSSATARAGSSCARATIASSPPRSP